MSEDLTVLDLDGNEVTKGTRVRPACEQPGGKVPLGTVKDLGCFDGGVDDNTGRSISIEPCVTILWDDGEQEEYTTSGWVFDYFTLPGDDGDSGPTGQHAIGRVEDLLVVKP